MVRIAECHSPLSAKILLLQYSDVVKRTGIVVGVGIVALIIVAADAVWWRAGRRPLPYNVLLITLDTTRADRLGCYGYAPARTPALDRLASEGLLFERAYSAVPLTLPSHATILTGLLPPEHGLVRNAEGVLPKSVPTLATVVRERGYATGAFVASPIVDAKYGLNRGFDTYDDRLPSGGVRGTAEEPYRPANAVAEPAVAWIKDHASGRFFCWVHFFDAHWPYYLHEDVFGQQFASRPYDAGIAFVDLHVAKLLRALDELGLRRKTLVVVVGDHGESSDGEHREPRPHHGYMLYNPTLRVPLIYSLPGAVAANRRVPQPVSLVDLYPTVAEFLRLPAPRSGRGVSHARAFRGRPISPRECYAETAYPPVYGCAAQQSLVAEPWKYIRSPRPELYDLSADPGELRNLASAMPDKIRQMDQALAALEQGLTRRPAGLVQLTTEDRRRLESLGYVGGGGSTPPAGGLVLTNDIKDAVAPIALGMEAEELGRTGRRSDAIAMWRRVVAARPGFLTFRNSLAAALMDQADYPAAEQELRPLLAELKERLRAAGAAPIGKDAALYPVAAHNLALTLAYRGQFQEALPLAIEAIELSPDVGAMRFTLANVYERLGRDREALTAAEEAVRRGYTYPDCVTLLAELCLKTGDKAKAMAMAQAVMDGSDVQASCRERAQRVVNAVRPAGAAPAP